MLYIHAERPSSHFNRSTGCTLLILHFSATAALLGNSILLLSTVDPFGTGGHGDPSRGTLPGETGHQFVTVDFPFLFPLYFPLVSLYLSSSLFAFAPFPPFSLGVLYLLPLFWEWPRPEKQATWRQSIII